MSEKRFISPKDFIKRIQQESANWRDVLKPGIRIEVITAGNAKVDANPATKSLNLDQYGKRQYKAQNADDIYTATVTGVSMNRDGEAVASIEYNVMTEDDEGNLVPTPFTDKMQWDVAKYYVNPSSLQTAGRRRGRTLRRRRTGKTRRGRKH